MTISRTVNVRHKTQYFTACVIWIPGNFAIIKQEGGVGGNEYYTVWSVQPPLLFYVSNSLPLMQL